MADNTNNVFLHPDLAAVTNCALTSRHNVLHISLALVAFVLATGFVFSCREPDELQKLVDEHPTSTGGSVKPFVPPPPTETGELHSIAFDGSGHLFATLGSKVLRADSATLKVEWAQTVTTQVSIKPLLLLLPDRVAVASDGVLTFYSVIDGTLTGSYKISNAGFPNFCSVDNIVVVTMLGSKPLRVDALTARKSDSNVTCKLPPDILCQKGEVCSSQRRRFTDHSCVVNLRSGNQDFAPCDTDNGTGDSELVAFDLKRKILWSTKLNGDSHPTFMTVIGETVLVQNHTMVEAFDRAAGKPRWQKPSAGSIGLTPDLSKVLIGDGQTLVALDPVDGHEIGKLGPWPVAQTPKAP
jgi:outer membrane protein assembly factor BamB